MKKIIIHNLALKLIALGLAIVAWIYVDGEVKGRNFSLQHILVDRLSGSKPIGSPQNPGDVK